MTTSAFWDSVAIVPFSSPSEQGRSKAVANQAIPRPGTLLLDSTPTAAVLVDAAKGTRCDECLQPLKHGRKVCASCKEDIYCGPSCQASAWKRHHKLLCKQLPAITYKLKAQQLDEPSRLDAILLARLAAEHFSTSDRTPSQLVKTTSLETPESLLPHELFISLLPSHSLITESPLPSLLAPHFPSHLSPSELALLLARFSRNNHVLTSEDSRLESYANVVLAGISRAANHSCSPTAVISVVSEKGRPPRVGLRTACPLEEGDEITISYLDPLLSRKTRQETLELIYEFVCACPLCLTSAAPPPRPHPLSHPDLPPSRLASLQALDTPSYPIIPRPTVQVPISEPQITKLTKAYEDASHDGKFDEAVKLGVQTLQLYWAGYGAYRPIIATHLVSLARVELNRSILLPIGDPKGRLCLARGAMLERWAKEVGRVVWGESGEEWAQELEQVEQALEGELAATAR